MTVRARVSGEAVTPRGDPVTVRVRVNGDAVTLRPHTDESALEALRDRLGLTGAKAVCGTGACGACTMHLDGVPVASCLLPVHRLEGRSVTTIEGIGAELHPVQRGLIAADGLQCGFCTPGIVMSAIAFYDRWRAEHGATAPSRDRVAEALAGHLCRCGAYPGVLDAVRAACSGRPGTDERGRPDARAKVTGAARYTVDVREPGQLEGLILRSPHAHALVRRVDLSGALASPGMRAAVALVRDGERVRYVGQEVAAVAGADRRSARAALDALVVDYEPLPAAVGIDGARRSDAPVVWTGVRRRPPSLSEGPPLPARWRGNVRGPVRLASTRARRARRAIAAGEGETVRGTWSTSAQAHTALEPHACVAHWRDDGLTLHVSTQAVSRVAEQAARRFGLARERVRVLAEHVGGGFGAKLHLTPETVAAVELSRLARAPVRVVLDRREELTVAGYRPAVEVDLALAADRAGGSAGLRVRASSDGGVAVGSHVAALLRFCYPGAKDLADYDVVSHKPPGAPFRGPGGPVALWAVEQAVDELAHRRGEDPLALRRRWNGNQLRRPLYDWAEGIGAWRERGAVAGGAGRFRRGVGLAMGTWFHAIQPATEVLVAATRDGLEVACAAQDVGTGSRAVLARALAGALGLPGDRVAVRIGDSELPRGPSSAVSSSTTSLVPAVEAAARDLREQILTRAHGLRAPRVVADGLRHAGGLLPWSELLWPGERLTASGRRARDDRRWLLPRAVAGFNFGRDRSAGAHISEVEVDTLLGRVRVLRVWVGIAAGRVVAPAQARSQCHGGVIQGIGFALYEERRHDPATGLVLSAGLEDYRIPGIGDVPAIEVHFHEQGLEHVRGGAIGLGELSTLSVAASIGNAVHHATGWRPQGLPIRPEHVIAGVRA